MMLKSSNLNFVNLNYKNKEHIALLRICKEIKLISNYHNNAAYKRFPYAASFLTRSIIEQTMSLQLKNKGRHEKLKSNNSRTPSLESMIKEFLKDFESKNYSLSNNDIDFGKRFVVVFASGANKDLLDRIIQSQKNFCQMD